jgi:uncharacterized repeat protein (TIGR01451 family)
VTGSNAAAASATLNVYAPPTLAKTFGAPSMGAGGSTTLTLTLGNPAANVAAITAAGVDDTFPAGLALQNTTFTFTPAACGTVTNTSGTASAAGDNSIRFIAASIAAGSTCRVVVNVTSSTTGSITNTTNAPTAAGPVALAGTAASAPLTVTFLSAPNVAKTFNPTQVGTGETSLVTVMLTNPNNIDITGVAFTDTLPASPGQMLTASVLSNGCGGMGTIASGNKSFSLSGGTIPANSSCSVSVTVTASTLGLYTNTTSTVTSLNAATASGASAQLTVALLGSPLVGTSFSPNQIGINGTSAMTITLTNPNSTAIPGVAFTETYPAGLFNSGAATSPQCGGTVTATNGANGGSLVLSGGTIPANGSCTVTMNVTSAASGAYINSTGPVSTTNASTGTAASATLNVLQAPTATKVFSPSAILPNGASVLTVTLANPNSIAVTGVQFTDTYPASPGSMVNTSSPTGATTCTSGTVTAIAGQGTFQLSGATIPGNGSCTVTVNITAPVIGSYSNTINTITTTNAGSAGPVSGTLTVLAPPTIAKAFAVGNLASGGNTSLTVTIGNTNAGAITLTGALPDTFPTGMTIGTAGNTGTCGGVTAAAGAGSFTMANGTSIPAGGCTIIVNVTSSTVGAATNTIAAGALQTTGGNNAASASATLNVYPLPNITMVKTAQTVSDPVNGTSSPKNIPGAQILYSILVTNFGTGTADANSIVITDLIPANTSLVVAGTPVGFTDGTTSSGLTFTWGGLSSQTDDVQFSRDGTDYTYVPTAGTDGADSAVKYLRINPKGTFKASNGTNNPSFTLTFKMIVN